MDLMACTHLYKILIVNLNCKYDAKFLKQFCYFYFICQLEELVNKKGELAVNVSRNMGPWQGNGTVLIYPGTKLNGIQQNSNFLSLFSQSPSLSSASYSFHYSSHSSGIVI